MQFLVVPYPLLKSTVKVNICEVRARVMQIYRSQGLLEMNIDAHFVLILLRIAHACSLRNSYLKLLRHSFDYYFLCRQKTKQVR